MGNRYWRLFTAALVNTVGDEFYLLALPLVMLVLGYQGSITTFTFGAMMFATVLGGLGLGYLVDRHPASSVMLRTYLASAVTLLGAAAAVAGGVNPYVVVIGVALVLGLLAALSAAAVDAGIPASIEDDAQVARGYSLVESARAAAAFLGPALAGVATRLHDLVSVMMANAASFTVSAALVWQRDDRATPAPDAEARWAEISAGAREVRSRAALRRGVLLSGVSNLSLGAEQPLFLTRMVRELHVSPLLTSAVVIGAGVASVVVVQVQVHLVRSGSALTTMMGANLLTAIAAVGIGLTGRWYLCGLLYGVMAAAGISYNVYWRTFRQQQVSPQLLGRVSAVCRSLAYLATAAGALLAGLAQNAGLSVAALFVAGGLVCAAGTVVIGGRIRRDSPGLADEAGDSAGVPVPGSVPGT